MNMKKTIAAVAAGAVAVSAMATTVSALQDTTLVYNLVANVKEDWGVPTTTFSFTVNTEATEAVDEVPGTPATYAATITNAATTAGVTAVDTANCTLTANKTYTYTNAAWDADPTADGLALTGTPAEGDTITVTYTAGTAGTPAVDAATNYPTEIVFTAKEGYNVDKLTMKVASNEAGEQNKVYTYTTDKGSFNYNTNLTVADGVCTLELSNELSGYTGNLALTFTVEASDNWWNSNDTAKVNGQIAGGTIKAEADAGNVTPVTYVGKKDATGKGNAQAFPFYSDINGSEEIMSYLSDWTNGLVKPYYKGGDGSTEGMSYKNVEAVLNDAIENYENVTFTFNTATGKIKDGKYDADGSDYWMSFGQHLYTGFYTPETTGWTGFDWTGYNLFQGALVINERYTMSLAETDYFDWTATSLTFDWDAIMDGAMTDNSYANYLHSMELVTSTGWYWDNMTVTLTAGAADDVENEAGTEAGDEVLEEEEVEEEVVEEEVEEEVEEPEVEVEVANPTTGNASVALAVIPVALAAAAVVAKKRS